MKNNTIYILICCMMLITAASCKKNFMDRFPQTAIPPDLFFKSEEDLSIYINGLISLPGRDAYVSDQNTDDKATTGAQEIKSMMTGTPNAQNITGGWSWGRLRNINYFLQNYLQAPVSQEVKDHYAGLARYYRAEFYLDKVKRFSDVPWYSRALNPGDTADLYKARDSRSLVMDSVMADLEFASAHVMESVPVGTPGKWVVKLVYARTALYEGSYRKYHPELNLQSTANNFLQKAAQVADEIIVSGKFQLHSDYAALFNSASLAGNKEIILANIYDQDLNRNGGNNGVINNYEQSPARDLVQTYLMKDGSRFTDQPGYETFGYVQEFQNRDPRLSKTLMYPGIILAPATTAYVLRFNKNFTAYHQLKGYINTTDTKVTNSVDFPAYRFAEVLLIYAEALAELEMLTQADLDKSVNLLRSRAGITTPLNLGWANGNVDPVLATKYPDVSGANKGVILEIRRERRVEFAAEGYRFDDLMRWHAGKELEKTPEGMYFPGLGNYDLTGDGVPDIGLIDKNSSIPSPNPQGGIFYYKAGNFGESGVTVYLKNGNSGGAIVTDNKPRQFIDPKYYYRPIPFNQITLNPNLGPQSFGWD
ncbi:RagB/SusD family nutrient uptake outer membrane protein [Terrimonas alba]|uniref:RagB/SusD family nutrient uptake outer membrane protein n=1 Tax=Terrimonas alba TaxID=3349636 RepID=UPI0035F4C77C